MRVLRLAVKCTRGVCPSTQKYFPSSLFLCLAVFTHSLRGGPGGTNTKTTRLRNPPDISTPQRSGLCYVTPGLCAWQKRCIVLRLRAQGTLDSICQAFLTEGGRAASNLREKRSLTTNLMFHCASNFYTSHAYMRPGGGG